MTPEFHPAAQEELAAPVMIGDTRAAGLGLELLLETQRVVALLCNLPDVGEPLDERYRRFPLRRFPFGLVYRESTVLVCASSRSRTGVNDPDIGSVASDL